MPRSFLFIPFTEVVIGYLTKPLSQGEVFIPCRGSHPSFLVQPASSKEKQAPTHCNHPAWANEVITSVDGHIVHHITRPMRIVQNGFLAKIAPMLFARKVPQTTWCTRCELEEKLEGAIICGWCRNIIFVKDEVTLTKDDSQVIDLNTHRTLCAWDNRIVVCNRENCASRVQAQKEKNANDIDTGTWHNRYAILVSPR